MPEGQGAGGGSKTDATPGAGFRQLVKVGKMPVARHVLRLLPQAFRRVEFGATVTSFKVAMPDISRLNFPRLARLSVHLIVSLEPTRPRHRRPR